MSQRGGGKQRGGGRGGGGRGDGGQDRGRGRGRGRGGQGGGQHQQPGGQNQSWQSGPPQQQQQAFQPLHAAPPPAQSAWGARPQTQQPLPAAPPPAQSAWGQQPPQQQPPAQQPQQQKSQKKGQKQGKEKGAGGDVSSLGAMSISASGQGHGDGNKTKEVIAKGGSKGRPVQVCTNHFAMDFSNLPKLVTQYDVTIDPDRPKKQMRKVMEEFKKQHYPRSNPAYDGSKILFSAGILPFGDEISGTVKMMLDDREKDYKVTLKSVQQVDMGMITKFYDQVRNQVITDAPTIVLQVIDVVLRHSLALRHIVVGTSLFTVPKTDRTIDLGGGMHMYRGMSQSAILGWRPFLNVDVSNKAFPSAIDIIQLIKELAGRAPVDLANPLPVFMMENLRKHMRTLRVQYEIPKNASSRRNYRVNGVESNPMDHTFESDGQRINVFTYYQRMKGYTIRYPKMPLLWVGSINNKVMVPCELCIILPGQPVNRKCDPNQTRNMIRYCATSTDIRKDGVLNNVRNANYNADSVVRDFGLRISDHMEQVEARILDPPSIRYKRGAERVARGVWNAREFYVSGQIRTGWTILNLDRYVRAQDIQNLVKQAQISGRSLGMDMTNYQPIQPNNAECIMQVRLSRATEDLKTIFQDVKRRNLDLVFVILPGNFDRMYACVKLASEVIIGCMTQCIKSQTLQKRMNDMTMKNILMKVNAKLTGSNHIFDSPPQVMMKKYVMLMGADVTHPSPDVRDGFSVAAVVASHDPNAFLYNICWQLQPPGQEIILDMEAFTKRHLMRFYVQNKKMKPEVIIVYRDGVSTGQFEAVLQAELQAIRRACKSLGADYEPPITFIVVQKRHHTRFFPVDSRISQDKNNNVPAGTIVDKTITHPTRQDFYLVSHASIQGVAKPTKYVTLWDDNDISDDNLEELTYYLCHMFSRCTRSVSYPAPTYYAHLAAARGKAYCDGKGPINTRNLPREQQELSVQECIIKDKPMFFV